MDKQDPRRGGMAGDSDLATGTSRHAGMEVEGCSGLPSTKALEFCTKESVRAVGSRAANLSLEAHFPHL